MNSKKINMMSIKKFNKEEIMIGLQLLVHLGTILYLILGFINPIARIKQDNLESNLYLTKWCVALYGSSLECSENLDIFATHLWACYALFISLIVFITLFWLCKALNKQVLSDICGLVMIGISIAIITLLALITNFSYNNIKFQLSGIAIGVIIWCGSLILQQLTFNKLLHKVVLGLIRLITGK